MAYMSKTKRKRVMRQRLLNLVIVIAVIVAIFIAIWQIGLGSTVAKVNGTSIRSGNIQGVTYFSEYAYNGFIYSNTDTSSLTASEKTAADDSILLGKNSIVASIFIPAEILRQYFATEGRIFPNDEEKKTINETLESFFADRSTSEMFRENGIKREHVKYFLEYTEAIKVLQAELLEKNPITDEEAQKYYDENISVFTEPLTMQASHILIEDADHTPEKRAEIEAILERVNTGEDFAELAKEFSDDTSAESGGDLGSFGKGQMVAPFEEAALALEPGEVSDIVETEFGYHIIKLTSRTEEVIRPFEDESVRTEIDAAIGGERTQAELDRMTEAATIEYFGLINKTTGKPPVTQTELDEARGIDASAGASDEGSATVGGSSAGASDEGSAAVGDSGVGASDEGSAAVGDSGAGASGEGSAAVGDSSSGASDEGSAAVGDSGAGVSDEGSAAAGGSSSATDPDTGSVPDSDSAATP